MATRALVVGGTSGIGYAMACRLAAASASSSVIISGRTKPANLPHSNIEFRPIEATSMREIKHFTDTLKEAPQQREDKSKLDLLIMTQGIMTMAGRTETAEGIDRKMALHYYGKQLLIRELLPALKVDAKVVIVFDSIMGNPKKVNWEDMDLKKNFSLGASANHCQVMNDAMVQWFAAQQTAKPDGPDAQRQFVHAWPGGVNTEGLMREMPWLLGKAAKLIAPLIAVTPDKCAEYLLDGVNRGPQEGRHWSYINNKGKEIDDKTVFTEDEMARVAEHTWGLIDAALK